MILIYQLFAVVVGALTADGRCVRFILVAMIPALWVCGAFLGAIGREHQVFGCGEVELKSSVRALYLCLSQLSLLSSY